MFCRYCGAPNPDDSSFCARCGKGIGASIGKPIELAPPAGAASAPQIQRDTHPQRSLSVRGVVTAIVLVALAAVLWIYLAGRPRVLRGHTMPVNSVAFSPDGHTLASGASDGTIKLWDPLTGKYLRTLSGEPDTDWVAFSPDGRLLASSGVAPSGVAPSLILWDAGTGSELHAISPTAIAPDSQDAANAASAPNGAAAPSATPAASASQTDPRYRWIGPPAFSPDARLVAAATGTTGVNDAAIQLWFTVSGDHALTIAGYRGPVAFSPDGKLLAAGGERAVILLEASSGNAVHTLAGQSPLLRSIVFSPSGAMLATVGLDNSIRLYDVARGDPLRTLTDAAGVRAVAFSPDGRTLASGGDDHTIKLWHVSSGRLLHKFSGHDDAVNCLAFSPNGRLLASGGADDKVMLWSIPPTR